MTEILKKIKNNKLLTMVTAAYIFLLIFMPDKAFKSLSNSIYYVKEMLMIMPVILLLTSLITAWVPKAAIENNFGKDSGFKGSVFSFLLGSFSAGPIYAAFPVCKMLLKKGASVSNIIIILSTWAVIKVPMLLNEAKFLGPKFMAIRWILTAIAIFVMAYISSKLIKRDEIPMNDIKASTDENKLYINQEYCIGCGLCAKKAPEYFEIENKKALIKNNDINDSKIDIINEAIDICPVKAIKY